MNDTEILNWDMPKKDDNYDVKEMLRKLRERLLTNIDDTRAGSVIHQNHNYLLGFFNETFDEVLENKIE